jgi:hypothetical protein
MQLAAGVDLRASQPVQVKPSQKVPHTGPGHAAGDPGWCEGCYAELQPVQVEVTAVRNAIANVLVNASNHPKKVTSHLLGQDMTPLIDKVTGAVVAALGGGDHE